MTDKNYAGPALPERPLHMRENSSQAINWHRKNPTIRDVSHYIKGLSGEIARNNKVIAQNRAEADMVRNDLRTAADFQWKTYAEGRLADICIHNRKLERENRNLTQQMQQLLTSPSSTPLKVYRKF